MSPRHTARGQLNCKHRNGKSTFGKTAKPTPLVLHTIKISRSGEEWKLPASIASQKRAIRAARKAGQHEIGRESGEGFPQPVTVRVFAGKQMVFEERFDPKQLS